MVSSSQPDMYSALHASKLCQLHDIRIFVGRHPLLHCLTRHSLYPCLLRFDMLQHRPRLMQEVIRIRLRHDPPLLRFRHIPLIPLLFRERNRIFLAVEFDVGALHEVGGRLPAHQRVLPAVAFGEDVPVHAPGVGAPCSGLGGWFYWLVDSADSMSIHVT
jgi:hypothetical protein